jgi:hypothetical protein
MSLEKKTLVAKPTMYNTKTKVDLACPLATGGH